MSFIEKLSEACDKATDGPWVNEQATIHYYDEYKHICITTCEDDGGEPEYAQSCPDIRTDEDAEYIALANPQTMRWLLDVIDDLKMLACDKLAYPALREKIDQGPNPQKEGG